MQLHAKTLLIGLLFMTTAALSACGGEEKKAAPSTYKFPLEVSASDTNKEPVAGARVLVDGTAVGYTDRDGLFQAALTEQVGAEVTVSVEPPDGFKLDGDATTTQKMSLTENMTGKGKKRVPVSLQAQLASTRKDYLLWVDLQCDETLDSGQCIDVPLMIDGEEVARTNEQGIAHLTVERVPASTLNISIDTPEYDGEDEDEAWKMKPADSEWSVDLGTDSQVLVIEQAFTDPAAADRAEARARRRAARRAARRRAARRSNTKSKDEKKEKKEDGVIQLW